MPFKLFSVCHQSHRASNADSTEHSLHQGSDANQHFPVEQSNLISSQPIVSAPLVQQFLTPHNLVGSLYSVHACRPTAPSPLTPDNTSLAFPVQSNSNIYTTAQPVSQPEMLTSHWRSHKPPKYVSNACIKLPPIQIPKFDGDPLAFHDWINIFKASVHDNTFISQSHRITYLQNSVSGKAKDLIRGYSCNPAFYNVAFAELESRFGSPQHIVTANIHRLENWALVSSQNHHTLVSFFTFLKQLVQTFINLRFTADHQSSTVPTIAKEKLPHNLLLKWTEHSVENNILSPTLLEFQQWLKIQARLLEPLEPNLPRPNKPSVPLPGSSSPSQNTQKKQNECPLCHQHLSITRCPQYLDSSIQDRIQHVQRLHLYFNCLGQSHLKKDCPSSNRCFKPNCGALHHTSLHTSDSENRRPNVKKTFPNKPKPVPASTQAPENRPNASNAAPAIHQKSSHNNSRQHQFKPSQFNATTSVDPENKQFPKTLFALLQVIPVSLLNRDKDLDTYALIDSGSTGTYVLDSISHSLDLETGHHFDLDVQFMNLSLSFSVRPTAFKIAPYADNETQFEIKNVYTTACLNFPPANISDLNGICQSNSTLRHIKFPDIDKGRIGVLLGTSCVQFTHALEWIRGYPTPPADLRTELGWTIAGEFMYRRRTKSSFRKNFVLLAATEIHRNAADQFPPDMLEQYWSIEKTASEPAESFVLSDVDNEALQTLEKTCRHNGERYEIALPWKSDVNLPNNYYAALNRVCSLEKRLTRNLELKKKFDETLTTDLQKQYVTPVVMQNPLPEKIWYLQTHPVENPNKPDKVRRVANAASKYKNESLNSNLLAGPDLLANLLELILRFREHAVDVLADIEGIFMQIAIRPEDQSALRFLWMSDN